MIAVEPLTPESFRPFGEVIVEGGAPRPMNDGTALGHRDLAFAGGPGQGVNFAAGVWHHPLIADAAGRCFLVVDRTGPGENLGLADPERPVMVRA